MQIDFPYHIERTRRTATTDNEAHVRDLIEQLLFTAPGERVNRPTFGCGLPQLVFAPNGDELATATQLLVHGSLQQWLGEVIFVDAVTVESVDATLRVVVRYRLRRDNKPRVAELTRSITP
jgi:phage baseplate assembly protein W